MPNISDIGVKKENLDETYAKPLYTAPAQYPHAILVYPPYTFQQIHQRSIQISIRTAHKPVRHAATIMYSK